MRVRPRETTRSNECERVKSDKKRPWNRQRVMRITREAVESAISNKKITRDK